MNEPQETQSKPEAGQTLAPTANSAPTRDPRNNICAAAPAVGARMLAMCRSKWLEDWWISYSPRNDNQNAEGTWEEWVSLASKILEADVEWKAQNARTERQAHSGAQQPETSNPVRSSELVRRLVENHPQLSPRERHNINRALDAGEAYGYGNVISWLMTEWAVNLRDKWGMDENTAIRATRMSPYPLPPNAAG